MRKISLCSAIVLFGICLGTAQDVKLGIKAGLNLASIGGEDTADFKGRTSFHAGGVVEILISEKFSIQPELLYSSMGAKDSFSDSDAGFTNASELEIKLDYLNLPIMVKFYLSEGLSIEAGPQIGFLLSAETDFTRTATFNGMTETISGTEDIKDIIESVDFALGVGLGYKLNNGLNFQARYNAGLSNILDTEGEDNLSNQNNVIQLSVGFMF